RLPERCDQALQVHRRASLPAPAPPGRAAIPPRRFRRRTTLVRGRTGGAWGALVARPAAWCVSRPGELQIRWHLQVLEVEGGDPRERGRRDHPAEDRALRLVHADEHDEARMARGHHPYEGRDVLAR